MIFKLDQYFGQVGYRLYETTNDVKYCLFTHHNLEYPLKQECIFCGGCCGPNGCNTGGCNTRAKCGIKAISIWQLIAAVFGVYEMVSAFSLCSESLLTGFLMGFYSILSIYCHIVSGIYGIKLTGAKDGVSFHRLSHLAMVHYAVLAGIYCLAFVYLSTNLLIVTVFYLAYYGTNASVVAIVVVIVLTVAGFVCYLPFEAIQLIDSNAKWETCTARKASNNIEANVSVAMASVSAAQDENIAIIGCMQKETRQ